MCKPDVLTAWMKQNGTWYNPGAMTTEQFIESYVNSFFLNYMYAYYYFRDNGRMLVPDYENHEHVVLPDNKINYVELEVGRHGFV